MIVVPRLQRDSALAILERLLTADLNSITSQMPDTSPVVTYSPSGGTRITDQQLRILRAALLDLAHEYGMPGPLIKAQEFEGRAARLIHELLPMSQHEFAHEEVWSYLTCCWLLDIAVWRFGHDADTRRFIGDVNRNTFRRMWWRTDVLGERIDLTQLGEDELVNITERPTIAADRRLARAVATEFLARVERGEAESRMLLMREVMKRLLRLTPFITFAALDDETIQASIEDVFDAASAGLISNPAADAGRHRRATQVPAAASLPDVSPDVVTVSRMTITERPDVAWPAGQQIADDFEAVAEAALDIARRAGRVTNEGLRAVVPISADEARAVFRSLIERGSLAKRGVKLGTHYVIPDADNEARVDIARIPNLNPVLPATDSDNGGSPSETAISPSGQAASRRSNATALRRLLRRGR